MKLVTEFGLNDKFMFPSLRVVYFDIETYNG